MDWITATVFFGGFLPVLRLIPLALRAGAARRERPPGDIAGLSHRRLQTDRLRADLHSRAWPATPRRWCPTSGEVVLRTLLCGLGTVFGSAVGALVVTPMENYLAQSGTRVMVTQGVIFIIYVRARDYRRVGGVPEDIAIAAPTARALAHDHALNRGPHRLDVDAVSQHHAYLLGGTASMVECFRSVNTGHLT